MYTTILIAVVAIALFALIVGLVKRYKRCPSDSLLVIYGKTGKNTSGQTSTAKVLHGGGAFVWPIIQDYEFLDLKPMPIEIPLKNALSKQNIRIDVPSTVTVAISTTPDVMQNAAERLLGLGKEQISKLAEDIIFGQMRLVVATMDIEEINTDRDTFLENIQKNLELELQKIGLKLINVNVTDIRDESGYIEALGKEAAAQAINAAKKTVAEKDKEGAIGVAIAQKDQRVEVAGANAKAINGENTAKIEVAKSDAKRQVEEAKALKESTSAEKVQAAEALEEAYAAEKKSEDARAKRKEAEQKADIIIPAQIEKEKIQIDADAEADRIRKIAKGEADAVYAKMEAEAKGIKEILTKRAEGFEKLVQSAGSSEKAVQMIIAENLQSLVATQVDAIKGVKLDKITVWDSGNGKNGESSTASFMKDLLNVVPPLGDMFKMAGAELPGFLQPKDNNIKKLPIKKIENANDITEDINNEKK